MQMSFCFIINSSLHYIWYDDYTKGGQLACSRFLLQKTSTSLLFSSSYSSFFFFFFHVTSPPLFQADEVSAGKIQKKQRLGSSDAYFTPHPGTKVQNRKNDKETNYDESGIQKGNKGSHHPKNCLMVLWCRNTSQCLQLWKLCPYGWSNWVIRSLIETNM